MKNMLSFLLMGLVLTACASKPPVQAMAEARAAVQSVRPLYQNRQAENTKTYKHFQSAERALLEASKALDEKKYALAKQKAKEAKRHARFAAKLKQK